MADARAVVVSRDALGVPAAGGCLHRLRKPSAPETFQPVAEQCLPGPDG